MPCRRRDLNPYALAGTCPSSPPEPSAQQHRVTYCLVRVLDTSTQFDPDRPSPCRCLVTMERLARSAYHVGCPRVWAEPHTEGAGRVRQQVVSTRAAPSLARGTRIKQISVQWIDDTARTCHWKLPVQPVGQPRRPPLRALSLRYSHVQLNRVRATPILSGIRFVQEHNEPSTCATGPER